MIRFAFFIFIGLILAVCSSEVTSTLKADIAAAATHSEHENQNFEESGITLTHEQAEDLVRTYLNLRSNSKVHVKYDHDAENGDYIIQVFEIIIDDPKTGEGHTATWGWYGVNKTTKNIYDAMN